MWNGTHPETESLVPRGRAVAASVYSGLCFTLFPGESDVWSAASDLLIDTSPQRERGTQSIHSLALLACILPFSDRKRFNHQAAGRLVRIQIPAIARNKTPNEGYARNTVSVCRHITKCDVLPS